MGFVRVSGYSLADLQRARLNAACDYEYYCIRGRSSTNYLSFKFAKDYAWALVCMANVDSGTVWTGTGGAGQIIPLGYYGTYAENSATYTPNTNNPIMVYIRDIKKGDIYGRDQAVSGSTAVAYMHVIACPYDNGIDVPPEDVNKSGGYFLGPSSDPTKWYCADTSGNYHYGTNSKKWFYDPSNPVIIPPIEDIPVSSSSGSGGNSGGNSGDSGNGGGSSGGSGSGGNNNEPEDQDDPINPGDPN